MKNQGIKKPFSLQEITLIMNIQNIKEPYIIL